MININNNNKKKNNNKILETGKKSITTIKINNNKKIKAFLNIQINLIII